MRSRLSRGIAIAALALGIAVVAFAGISLAASGGSGTSGQAAQVLGGDSAPGTDNNGDVQNEVAAGGQTPSGTSTPSSGNAPVTVSHTSSGNKALPFTGLLVIPVLLAGLALLGTGLVLRRREFTAARS